MRTITNEKKKPKNLAD